MKSSAQLFESTALLDWLPDETFFSLVSRNHYLWGHGADWRTSEMLFGSRRIGIHHDLPNGIGVFAERTDNQLGTVDEIVRQRTLLKYYGRFLSAEDEHEAVLALSGNSVAHLKYRLGLLTSRFRANHPLKACTSCMEENAEEFGWAYWHMEHQYPGVWWCNIHDKPLQESLLKSTGVNRFLWHLPSNESMRQWPHEVRGHMESAAARLSYLSHTTIDLIAETQLGELDPSRLIRAYRVELAQRGWLTEAGSLRLAVIAESFLEYSRWLRLIPELEALPTTIEESKAQIGRLLRMMHSGTHPLRHILIIDWLFGNAEAFLKLYRSLPEEVESAEDEVQDHNAGAHEDDNARALSEKMIQLMKVEGLSARATAEQLGVDTSTVIAWASQHGIEISRRPKILKSDRRKLLIADLRKGMDKAATAQAHGISVVTVTKVLLSEIGLHEAWQKARQKITQTKNRKVWSKLLAEYGGLGTKIMRSMKPAVYTWLYRNDRSWLQQNLPVRCTDAQMQDKPRVAWDQRDLKLSAMVEAAVFEISSSQAQSKIQLWQLYQRVPELKAKLSVLDRLPLTRRVIERALDRRPSKLYPDDLLS